MAAKASDWEQARTLLRARRARVTSARVAVLAELLSARRALSHHELLDLAGDGRAGEPLDRVTLYRVLDWLTDAGLAHRITGPDRIFRYSSERPGHEAHGHFRCTACRRTFCMPQGPRMVRVVRSMLPEGFSPDDVDLTVSGRCAECGAGH